MALTQVTTGGVDENINIDSNTLKVDGTNNRVGIGTAAPSGLLHLAASSQPSLYFEDTGSSNTLSRVYKSGSALTFNSRHTSAGQFVFNSENSGGTVTERMRIDASGNVGIGSSPVADAVLTLSNDTDTALFFRRGLGTNQDAAIRCAGGDFQFLNGANSSTVAGLSERMRIDNLGNVGIGNSSPVNSNGYNTLTIGNGTSTGGQILLENSSGNNFFIWHDSNGANIYNQSATSQLFYTNATERMRIDSSGRVLIGLSSGGTSPLNIEGAEGTAQLRIGNTNAAATDGDFVAGIDFHIKDNNDATGATCTSIRSIADQNHTATAKGTALTFHTTASDTTTLSERVRLDAAGQIQVGNNRTKTDVASTVAALVQTRFAGAFTNYSAIRESGPASFCFGRANGSGSQILSNGDEIGGIRWAGADGTDLETQAALIQCFVNGTPGSNNMPGRLKFSTSDGTNAPTERLGIDANGIITTNGVQQHSDRGATTGSSSFTRDYTIGSTQSALVIAAFNHYGLFSYGCTKISFAATGASFSTQSVHNQTSSPGGSWSITKPNNTTLRVEKTAGNYNGSGHWFIHVIAS